MSSKNYKRHDIRRACDCCGAIWFMSQLRYVGQNRWFCPDDAPGLTAEQISRHNAMVRPLIIRQAKHPRPYTQNSSYRLSEGACYRTVMDFAGVAEYVDQNGGIVMDWQYVSTIAQCGLYLADLVADGNRPLLTATARVKYLALADQLLSMQHGAGTGTDLIYYGAIEDANRYAFSLDHALAGKLFLRAYAETGAQKYLDGADLVANFLRRMQCLDTGQFGDVKAVDSSGAPLRVGGFAYGINVATRVPSGVYSQADMGLSFLKDLKAVRGGSAVYGHVGLPDWSTTLDDMIAQATGFYVDGSYQSTPLLSSTPKAYFSALLTNGTGTGTFQNYVNLDGSEYIRSWEFCTGLRSLFDLEGYTARVASMLSWLLGFSSTDGYDPTLSPAQYLKVKDPSGVAVAVNDGTIYDLEAGSLLAPILIARGESLRTLKDTLDKKYPLTADSTDALGGKNGVRDPFDDVYPGPTGQLSFDLTAPMSTAWVDSAAAVGGLYRYAPRALDNFPGLS